MEAGHGVSAAGIIAVVPLFGHGVVNLFAHHRAVNVDALANIAELQARLGAHLTHISTLSVFVHTNDTRPTYNPETVLGGDTEIIGGYAQSKVAAELALERHPGPLTVVRPGLLTPAIQDPRFARNDLLRDVIVGLTHLGVVPDLPELCFDVTPVDWAAEQIVNGPIANEIQHVSMGCIYLRGIRNTLNLKTIDLQTWQKTVPTTREARTAKLALARHSLGAESLHAVDLFQRTGTGFGPDLPLPEDLLESYVRAALEHSCAA